MERKDLVQRMILPVTLAITVGAGSSACGPAPGDNGNGGNGNGGNGGNGEPELTLEEKLEKLPPGGAGFSRYHFVVPGDDWAASYNAFLDESGDVIERVLVAYDTADPRDVHIFDIASIPGEVGENPEQAPSIWWPVEVVTLQGRVVVAVQDATGALGIHVYELREGRLLRIGSYEADSPTASDTGLIYGAAANSERVVLLFENELMGVSVDADGRPSIDQRVAKPDRLATRFSVLTADDILLDLNGDLDVWSFGLEGAQRISRGQDLGSGSSWNDRHSVHHPDAQMLYTMGTCRSSGEGRPMHVIDHSDPADPVLAAEVSLCDGLGSELPPTLNVLGTLQGDRIYKTWHDFHIPRVLVLDLSEDPAAPQALGWIDPLGTNGARYNWVHATADRLYFSYLNNDRDGTWVPLGWAPIDELEIEPIVEPDPQ